MARIHCSPIVVNLPLYGSIQASMNHFDQKHARSIVYIINSSNVKNIKNKEYGGERMVRIWRQTAFMITLVLIAMLLIQPQPTAAKALTQKPKIAGKKQQQGKLTITIRPSREAAFISDLQIESREMNAALLEAKQVPALEADTY